ISQERGFSQRILGFTQALSAGGYSIGITPASRDEKNQVYTAYRRWLKEASMDGYILASVPAKVQEIVYQEATVPVINMGYVWSGVDLPSVEIDFRAIYRNIVMVLAERGLVPFYNIVPAHLNDPEAAFFFNEVI